MKKTTYIALGALTILTNLANAACMLDGLRHIDSVANYEGNLITMIRFTTLGKIEEAIIQPAGPQYVHGLRADLGQAVSPRDIAIMRKLVHLHNPVPDVADPYADIVGQAMDLFAGIPEADLAGVAMTNEEKELWVSFVSLYTLTKSWKLPQMPDDDFEILRGGDINMIVNAHIQQHMGGVHVDFHGTMAILNAKIDAYRASVGLPAL